MGSPVVYDGEDVTNVLKILLETIEGYRDGGVEEAVSEGVEEVAEEATGRDF